MTKQPTLELEDFPAVPDDDGHWLHDDGRVFFIWPARDRTSGQPVQVQVEVTSIRSDAVAAQLRPTRKSVELAARELYQPGTTFIRLMRPDAYWIQHGTAEH